MMADAVASLAELQAATQACRECPIGAHATQSVVGAGPPRTTAARSLLGRTVAVTPERGQWLQRGDGRRMLPEREASLRAFVQDLRQAEPGA